MSPTYHSWNSVNFHLLGCVVFNRKTFEDVDTETPAKNNRFRCLKNVTKTSLFLYLALDLAYLT